MVSMRVHTGARPTDAEQTEWERQLDIMINEHKNYPSIVTWVIYNEGWGQRTDYYPEFKITDRIRELDPTRLIDAVTGWEDHGAGDFLVSSRPMIPFLMQRFFFILPASADTTNRTTTTMQIPNAAHPTILDFPLRTTPNVLGSKENSVV